MMDEFIFGVLPSEEQRLQNVLEIRRGISHQEQRSPFDPQPGQAVRLRLSVGPEHFCQQARVYWTTRADELPGPGGNETLALEATSSEWDTALWGYIRHFEAVLPGQPAGTVVRYRIAILGPSGQAIWADQGEVNSYYVDDDPPPAWTRSAVVYQIFVDRFNPGPGRDWQKPADMSGIFGGTLRGITQRLDHLTELGVNVLWLSPIFPSPSHHGYDASDYREVEPRLGTKADLRELLDQAHARGLRVLLDLVPNHWSSQHPTFRAAQADAGSPYREWYLFTHWPDQYVTFFGAQSMPKINLRNPAARAYMLDTAVYWLDFGVDGFRIDHAIGPAREFWAEFRRRTRAGRPDSWTFGEVTDPPDAQLRFTGRMDGCLDFLLAEALRSTFAYGRWDGTRLADFLGRHDACFPEDFSRPSFLDNHDMNRFLWASGGDQRRLRLAALCQFSLPGAPAIYHGTEVGLTQEHGVHEPGRGLEEARPPHLWGDAQDRELFNFYRGLIRLRHSQVLLRGGRRQFLQVGDTHLVYRLGPGGNGWVVALNLKDEPLELSVPGESAELKIVTSPECRIQSLAGCIQLHLSALGGIIYEEQPLTAEG